MKYNSCVFVAYTKEECEKNIGKRCTKKNNTKKRPFKSGFKTNTISGVINHPILNIPAYTFVEDDSYVECRRCEIIEKQNPTACCKRVGIMDLDILHTLLKDQVHTNDNGKTFSKKNEYVELFGYQVKITSQRYAVFQRSIKCCKCGIEGKFFAIERNESQKGCETYHLNLYGINDLGEEVLMTKDHILSVHGGGKSRHDNYQTMCFPCNYEKGIN